MRSDTLKFLVIPPVIRIAGEIACLGNLLVRVEKYLSVNGYGIDAEVQTYSYSYNVSVRGHGNLVRYDNAHVHAGHRDPHHRHRYDWGTGAELPGSPEWIGEPAWPTLGAVLQDLEQWYWENRTSLPKPDSYPELGLSHPPGNI